MRTTTMARWPADRPAAPRRRGLRTGSGRPSAVRPRAQGSGSRHWRVQCPPGRTGRGGPADGAPPLLQRRFLEGRPPPRDHRHVAATATWFARLLAMPKHAATTPGRRPRPDALLPLNRRPPTHPSPAPPPPHRHLQARQSVDQRGCRFRHAQGRPGAGDMPCRGSVEPQRVVLATAGSTSGWGRRCRSIVGPGRRWRWRRR